MYTNQLVNSDSSMTPSYDYYMVGLVKKASFTGTVLLGHIFQPHGQGTSWLTTLYFVLMLLPSPPTRAVVYFFCWAFHVSLWHPQTRIFRRPRSLKALLVDADSSWLASSYGAWRDVNRLIVYWTLRHCAYKRLKERPDFFSFKSRCVLLVCSIYISVSDLWMFI